MQKKHSAFTKGQSVAGRSQPGRKRTDAEIKAPGCDQPGHAFARHRPLAVVDFQFWLRSLHRQLVALGAAEDDVAAGGDGCGGSPEEDVRAWLLQRASDRVVAEPDKEWAAVATAPAAGP